MTIVDWPEIWISGSILCFIFADTAFLLGGADLAYILSRVMVLWVNQNGEPPVDYIVDTDFIEFI